MLRFRSCNQLRQLLSALQTPSTVTLANNADVTSAEILLVSFYRYHLPTTCDEVGKVFSMDYTLCSRIFNYFVSFLVERRKILTNMLIMRDCF